MYMDINEIDGGIKNQARCALNNIRSIISDIKEPVFIVDSESGNICEVNKAVVKDCGPINLAGKNFHDIVYTEKKSSLSAPVFFNTKWYNIQQELFEWEGKTYIKVILRQNPTIPDSETLFTIRNMIAVLVHRLRSPLTGMQGYLDLIEEVEVKSNKRKLDKINKGLNHIFEIMDELELLHNSETNTYHDSAEITTDPEMFIKDILFDYPADVRNRIKVMNPNNQQKFNYNPIELKKILSILVDNAVEHPSGKNHEIKIHIVSSRCLKISNDGKPIPPKIARKLFFPFVTSKVGNMGIGLTFAQLLANRRQATILLTENSIKNGISFSLYLPPSVH